MRFKVGLRLWIALAESRRIFPGMSLRVQAVPCAGIFKRASIRETTTLLAVAWLVPFVLHLLPWQGERPLGAQLLPMFWTAFVAVYLYGLRTGFLVGLFAPALNLALTGLPSLPQLSLMSFEVVVFVGCAWWCVRRQPSWWLMAPACYLMAKLTAALLQSLPGGSLAGFFGAVSTSLLYALPGLVVLTAVNYLMMKLYPKQGGECRDDAPGV
jgi:uncharacterized membrane protein